MINKIYRLIVENRIIAISSFLLFTVGPGAITYYSVFKPNSPNEGTLKVSDVSTVFINLTQSLENKPLGGSGLFWVTYLSSKGPTASPIAMLQYITITNTTSILQTIESYSVSIKTQKCGWVDLVPIPPQGNVFWFTYDGLNKAKLFDFGSTSIASILENPIPSGGTVSGWWFFDSKIKCDVADDNLIQSRINLKTYSGIRSSYTTSLESIKPNEAQIKYPSFIVPPGKPQEDISGFYRKLFSS